MATNPFRSIESRWAALRDGSTTVPPTTAVVVIGVSVLIAALGVSLSVSSERDDADTKPSSGDVRAWRPDGAYERGDVVEHEGARWRAKVDNVNRVPGPSPRVGVPIGFGAAATGGADGGVSWVTSLADSGPGTLRAAAESTGPAWIRFRVSGVVELEEPILVTSDKTIDGRGADVTISHDGLILIGVSNVIVSNLRFRDGDGATTDAIGIRGESHTVWIDHCDFTSYDDGLVDITEGGTNVTVSWSRFSDQNKVMLINGRASDGRTIAYSPRVTLHHNLFDETYQRNPRALHGLVHAFNNYLRDWGGYGMRASEGGELFSEANIYEATTDHRALLTQPGREDFAPGIASSEGDLVGGEALIQPRLPSQVFDPARFYSYEAATANGALAERVLADAGWQAVPFGEWARVEQGEA